MPKDDNVVDIHKNKKHEAESTCVYCALTRLMDEMVLAEALTIVEELSPTRGPAVGESDVTKQCVDVLTSYMATHVGKSIGQTTPPTQEQWEEYTNKAVMLLLWGIASKFLPSCEV